MKHGQGHRQDSLFGGRGAVYVWDLLRQKQAPPFSAVLYCELEVGGEVGKHRQQRDPEIVIGVAGSGVAIVDDVECALEPGAVVHLALGATLSIRNKGSEPLEYLIVKATQVES